MPNKIDIATVRDTLKSERATLWAEFYDHPYRSELAIRIKALDDQIADHPAGTKKRG